MKLRGQDPRVRRREHQDPNTSNLLRLFCVGNSYRLRVFAGQSATRHSRANPGEPRCEKDRGSRQVGEASSPQITRASTTLTPRGRAHASTHPPLPQPPADTCRRPSSHTARSAAALRFPERTTRSRSALARVSGPGGAEGHPRIPSVEGATQANASRARRSCMVLEGKDTAQPRVKHQRSHPRRRDHAGGGFIAEPRPKGARTAGRGTRLLLLAEPLCSSSSLRSERIISPPTLLPSPTAKRPLTHSATSGLRSGVSPPCPHPTPGHWFRKKDKLSSGT